MTDFKLGTAQEMILKQFAKKLSKEGISQLIIDISENGEFNINAVYSEDERKTVISTDTYRFLTDYVKNNKPKTTL